MLILFDLDDTLFDHRTADRNAAAFLYENLGVAGTLSGFLLAWYAAQESHYARYSAGEISFRDQRRERLREVLDPTLADEAADRIFARFSNAYEANWTLFKDAVPCLDALSSHRIGLITNGQGQLQRRKLVTTRIADRFDCVLISEECGYSKPDERIFLLACELAGEAPKNAVYVGDYYDLDALAAREAGLHGIWLDRKAEATTEHEPPIIASLVELIPQVL